MTLPVAIAWYDDFFANSSFFMILFINLSSFSSSSTSTTAALFFHLFCFSRSCPDYYDSTKIREDLILPPIPTQMLLSRRCNATSLQKKWYNHATQPFTLRHVISPLLLRRMRRAVTATLLHSLLLPCLEWRDHFHIFLHGGKSTTIDALTSRSVLNVSALFCSHHL